MQRDDRTIGAAAMNDSRSPSFRSGKEGAAFFEGVPAARPNGAAKRPCGGSDGAARVAVASVSRSRSRLGRTAERSVRPTRRLPCGARFGKGRAGRRAARSGGVFCARAVPTSCTGRRMPNVARRYGGPPLRLKARTSRPLAASAPQASSRVRLAPKARRTARAVPTSCSRPPHAVGSDPDQFGEFREYL